MELRRHFDSSSFSVRRLAVITLIVVTLTSSQSWRENDASWSCQEAMASEPPRRPTDTPLSQSAPQPPVTGRLVLTLTRSPPRRSERLHAGAQSSPGEPGQSSDTGGASSIWTSRLHASPLTDSHNTSPGTPQGLETPSDPTASLTSHSLTLAAFPSHSSAKRSPTDNGGSRRRRKLRSPSSSRRRRPPTRRSARLQGVPAPGVMPSMPVYGPYSTEHRAPVEDRSIRPFKLSIVRAAERLASQLPTTEEQSAFLAPIASLEEALPLKKRRRYFHQIDEEAEVTSSSS
ncbi:hypothetical protein CSUI_003923 [Cystoisospora suis]|uniref:Transmembrane protein n=1 Tax=Cystoisospora suis TaxID=483139 RepID=A0A2C6L0L3_9APIC|nr:hypothetical protein CSUI_003923 [Cystoisospora suis]